MALSPYRRRNPGQQSGGSSKGYQPRNHDHYGAGCRGWCAAGAIMRAKLLRSDQLVPSAGETPLPITAEGTGPGRSVKASLDGNQPVALTLHVALRLDRDTTTGR